MITANSILNITKSINKTENSWKTAFFIISIYCLVHTAKVALLLSRITWEKLAWCCYRNNCASLDNMNNGGMYLYKNGLHWMESGKVIISNYFKSHLNKCVYVNKWKYWLNDSYPSCTISQEQYSICLWLLVNLCKMIISPGAFFIFFLIFIFRAVRGVKGQKMAQNEK